MSEEPGEATYEILDGVRCTKANLSRQSLWRMSSMLSETHHRSRPAALHRVLTRARTRAYLGADSQELGAILDDAEYLASLLLDGNAPAGEFSAMLQRMEDRYEGFAGVVSAFEAVKPVEEHAVRQETCATTQKK